MSVPEFPDTYATARDAFRTRAAHAACACEAFPVNGTGPNGEALTIDVAIATANAGENALVVSSGLHGVEGPLGSAIQLALLDRLIREPNAFSRVRLVLIHALNPYGYAWSRRVDADNIDVNRNFPVGAELQTGAYARFDRLLNPKSPPQLWDFFYARALAAIAAHGMPALKQTLITGQRDFPKGLFFAGTAPSQTRLIIEQHMASWIGTARAVTHLDFHTGLGKWGTYKLLADYPVTSIQRARLVAAFGAGTFEEGDPRGVAYRAHGTFGEWCAGNLGSNYLFAFAECGTYDPLSIIAGLRNENRAHHWGKPGDPATIKSRARLRELFCPAATDWRRLAVESGLELVERAVNELREPVQ